MKVFLDTNVLVSAFTTRGLCADLVRHLLTEHEIIVGEVVLNELRRVLRTKISMPEDVAEEILELLCEQTVVPVPEKPVAVTVRDPDDVHVLASAQAAGVDVLVSGDGDLLDLADSVSLRIVNPRGMWELLREEKPNP